MSENRPVFDKELTALARIEAILGDLQDHEFRRIWNYLRDKYSEYFEDPS